MEPRSIYCDLSASETRRYQSLGAVVGLSALLCDVREALADARGGHSEVKFSRLSGDANRSRIAADFVRIAIEAACRGLIQVAVMSWDQQDSRHAIPRRDDVANVGRMACHLFRRILRRHGGAQWGLYPDDGDDVDWPVVTDYIAGTDPNGPARTRGDSMRLVPVSSDPIVLYEVLCVNSQAEPLVQLADLFAGMVCFSHENGPDCIRHMDDQFSATLPLDLDDEDASATRAKAAKYELIGHLDRLCKRHKLGVSLRTHGYLVTKMPHSPITIWHYEPQADYDRAPTRE